MSFAIELKLPPDLSFISLLSLAVNDAAQRAGLDAAQCAGVAQAASAGFETIVREAMVEEREPVRLTATCTPEHLRISLYERGLPMDDSAAQRDPNWGRIIAGVEQAQWKLHGGRSGSELRLTVARPHGLADDAGAEAPLAQDVPLAPQQTYSVRRFRPEDAAGVARAFYLTYGYRYIFPAVYVPQRLIELNACDGYISMVALAEDGEIVGHYAMRRDAGTPVAEGCGAIVVPAHRGRGLLEPLRKAAEAEALRLGLAAYYTEPVTDHGRTQAESLKLGARLCGITLGFSPAPSVKHMDVAHSKQRLSLTQYYKPLASRERRAIYAPPKHRETIASIYADLGLAVELRDGGDAQGGGDLHTAVDRPRANGSIVVESIGRVTADVLAQTVTDLRTLSHLEALYVLVPLEDPAAPQLCEAAEALGFFFSGIAPWALEGRDALRLQQPLTPIDLSALTIVGESGEHLLSYIAARMREAQEISASAAT
jgi:anti-sigma regulatory factor (Ser/Thr protein kinase)